MGRELRQRRLFLSIGWPATSLLPMLPVVIGVAAQAESASAATLTRSRARSGFRSMGTRRSNTKHFLRAMRLAIPEP